MADKLGSPRPPLEFWRILPAGQSPRIEAPWGETWLPTVQTVAGVAIYNPYSLGPANSRRFLEWQYRRATLAVYGQEVDFNDYHLPTLRPLERQAPFVALNIATCLCWMLLLLNGVFLTMHSRVKLLLGGASNLAGFLLLVPMLLPFLDVLLKPPGGSLGTALMNAALLRILALLPFGAAVLFAALPLGLLWWSALRLFDDVEPPHAEVTIRA